jgi:murein DD-endopeptidase MepM/ murein hydrolase activator NlpD
MFRPGGGAGHRDPPFQSHLNRRGFETPMTVTAEPKEQRGPFSRWLGRRCPDRQNHLQNHRRNSPRSEARSEPRSRSVTLSTGSQIAAALLLGALGAWATVATMNYTALDKLVDEQALEVASAEQAYQALLGKFVRHRSRLQAVNQEVQRLNEIDRADLLAVRRMSERTAHLVAASQKLIQRTGLDMARLMNGAGGPEPDQGPERQQARGQGGPFIEVAAGAPPRDRLNFDIERLEGQLRHWAALQGVVKRLPLNPPLDAFAISSGFGGREDPINRRDAVHHGLDLIAPLRSPVYATAAGVVVFSGVNGTYGRYIEIEHGAGLQTRFGHLHRLLVKRGEIVTPGQMIGLLGNSGRSTGPHLHYEVRFNDEPRDPMKFIQAGRYVFKE